MSGRVRKIGTVASAVAVVVLLVIGLLVGSSGQKNVSSQGKSGDQKPAASCWAVKLDPNQGNRVLSSGVSGTPDQVRTKLLNAAQHDPRVLQALYNVTPQGSAKPVTDWHSLVDGSGKCYSQQGQALWNKTGVLYATANATKSTAPATGCNTYVTPSGNASCKVETITGNRAGTKFDFGNGKWVVVMYRCGNPVTPGKPPVPVSPKPPTSPPTTPPTHQPSPKCTQPPAPGPGEVYNSTTCTWSKPPQSFNCQQNGSWTQGCPPNQADQPVQSNPGQPVGTTSGAPSSPPPPPQPGPTPTANSPAPTPAPSGYDSGSGSGSGTPGGSTCDNSGCTGGGSTPASGPTDTTNSGDNNGTDGSGTSTGSGDPGNPFS